MIRKGTDTEDLVQADRELRGIDKRLDSLEKRQGRTFWLLGVIVVELILSFEAKWTIIFEWLGMAGI